jgi:hypothetical protein
VTLCTYGRAILQRANPANCKNSNPANSFGSRPVPGLACRWVRTIYEEFEFVMPAAPVQQRPEAANWGGLFLLVVGLNLLLLLPFGRPFFFVRQSRPLSPSI